MGSPPDGLRREYRMMHTDRGVCEVREMYLDADGEVVGWTGSATSLWGLDPDDLRTSVLEKLEALDRPMLVEADLPGYLPDAPVATHP